MSDHIQLRARLTQIELASEARKLYALIETSPDPESVLLIEAGRERTARNDGIYVVASLLDETNTRVHACFYLDMSSQRDGAEWTLRYRGSFKWRDYLQPRAVFKKGSRVPNRAAPLPVALVFVRPADAVAPPAAAVCNSLSVTTSTTSEEPRGCHLFVYDAKPLSHVSAWLLARAPIERLSALLRLTAVLTSRFSLEPECEDDYERDRVAIGVLVRSLSSDERASDWYVRTEARALELSLASLSESQKAEVAARHGIELSDGDTGTVDDQIVTSFILNCQHSMQLASRAKPAQTAELVAAIESLRELERLNKFVPFDEQNIPSEFVTKSIPSG